MKAFMTRLLSGALLLLLVGCACWAGGWPLWALTMVAGFIGLYEFYRVMEISMDGSLMAAGIFGASVWSAMVFLTSGGLSFPKEWLWMTLPGAFLLIMAVYVFTFPRYDTQKVMAAFFGIVYVPVMLSFIYQTRMLTGGHRLVWLIFICAWGCDTCAYCVGMLLGRHPLAPVLSPKKSVEGAVGGVVGAALLGAGFGLLTGGLPGIYAGICAVGAVASQIGDLAASAIKRQHGIKDYGMLIPGHGGILDRFDSVIVTAPMIYMLALWFAQ